MAMSAELESGNEELAKVRAAVAPLVAAFVREHSHCSDADFTAALAGWVESLDAGLIEESAAFDVSIFGKEFLAAAVMRRLGESGALGTA
jgi:hypothetical protein